MKTRQRKALLGWALVLMGVWPVGCSADNASRLDEDERRWVAEERTIPPTGGPMTAIPQQRPTPPMSPATAPRPLVPSHAVAMQRPDGQRATVEGLAPHHGVNRPVSGSATVASHQEHSPPPATVTGFPEPSVAEQVKVTIYPSTIITCDGPLEVDYEHSKATFHDNVHVTDERGELFADVMEVFFTPAHEISQVIASGHVRIIRGDDTAYSDHAIYLQKEGRVFLTGQPKLVLFPETTQQAQAMPRQPLKAPKPPKIMPHESMTPTPHE